MATHPATVKAVSAACPWARVGQRMPPEDPARPWTVILAPGPQGVFLASFATEAEAEALATQIRAAIASKTSSLIEAALRSLVSESPPAPALSPPCGCEGVWLTSMPPKKKTCERCAPRPTPLKVPVPGPGRPVG